MALADRQQAAKFIEQGQFADAQKCLVAALKRDPEDSRIFNLLGIATARAGDFEKALTLLQKAMALNDSVPDYPHNAASILRALGKFSEAEAAYRTAIRLKPDYLEAYFNLSATRRFTSDDAVITDLLALLARSDLTTADRCFGHFAAGKMLDDCGQYYQAFGHYRQANPLEGNTFDADGNDRLVEDIVQHYGPERFQQWQGHGVDNQQMIFVVGIPRSGTTLVEQILASHPDVYGAGELGDIAGIAQAMSAHDPKKRDYPRYVTRLPKQVPAGFATTYLQRVNAMEPGKKRYADKATMNFRFLGLIATMLPGATIIHCRRNALDTCLSCYFQKFRTGLEFSYDQSNLGRYYRSYQKLMRHWQRVLPITIFDLDYEDMVQNPEPTARRLLEHCGLTWDDRVMSFHQTNRAVSTASNHQVRQPIYTSSLARWRNYEPHLDPLKQALEWRED